MSFVGTLEQTLQKLASNFVRDTSRCLLDIVESFRPRQALTQILLGIHDHCCDVCLILLHRGPPLA